MQEVVVATGSTLTGLGLQTLLGTSLRVRVVALSDPESVFATLSTHLPDLLIIDAHCIDRCVTTCALAHDMHPDLPILILAPTFDDAFARAVLEAGARGCVCSDASAIDLVAAIRWVSEGQAVLDPRITAQLLRWALESEANAAEPLSSREREVLLLVSQGESNKRIASRLGVTEHTVKTYLKRASSKLGCRTRASAAARAMKQGWI